MNAIFENNHTGKGMSQPAGSGNLLLLVDIAIRRMKLRRAISYKTSTYNLVPQLARDELLLFFICKLDFWDLVIKQEDRVMTALQI